MKNLVRITFLALALMLAGMGTLSADLSCGIPCSTFNDSHCLYWYDQSTDSCVSADWGCPWYTCE